MSERRDWREKEKARVVNYSYGGWMDGRTQVNGGVWINKSVTADLVTVEYDDEAVCCGSPSGMTCGRSGVCGWMITS